MLYPRSSRLALLGGLGMGAGMVVLVDPRGRAPRTNTPPQYRRSQETRERQWPSSAQFVAGLAGAAMIVFALTRRSAVGTAVGALGACCMAGGIMNRKRT